MKRLLSAAACAMLFACAGGPPTDIPEELLDVPWRGGPGDAAILQARGLADRGRAVEALETTAAILRDHPRHVDAHRLRQDLLRERGRLGRLLVEAEQRIAEWGGDPRAVYLRGRIVAEPRAKRRDFLSVVEAAPELFWGWLGLAFAERLHRPDAAATIYARLYRATDGHPLVAIGYAALLRAERRYDDAVKIYAALRGHPAMPGVGDLGLAETLLLAERPRDAWPALLQTLRLRPFDAGARRAVDLLLAQGLSDERIEQLLAVLFEDPRRLEAFASNGGATTLAALFSRAGNPAAAEEALLALEEPRAATVEHRLRTLRLVQGDVRGFLRALREAFPGFLLEQEANVLRRPWASLLFGEWLDADDPIADPEHRVPLVRALRDVGLLTEAEMVATLALLRPNDAAARLELENLREELRREIAFEGALRRIVYQGYAGEVEGGLEAVFEHLRRLSKEIFGRDVVGDPVVFELPFVGRLVDPFGDGLAAHLAGYNKHLVLGQRGGGPVEGLLLTRLSLRFLEDDPRLPLSGRVREVVGEDRQIRSLQGVLGGDLAGVALLNHYVLDMDAVRDWARGLLLRRQTVREDGDALLEDPLPEDVDPLDPVDVSWRLVRLSSVRDTDLVRAVFESIAWHERAHLADSFRYLPPERHLGRVIGLILRHGFDAFSIESEMEGRAETASLAYSDHPRLVLAHVASFLEQEVPDSPHAEGFRRLARRLNARLRRDPELAALARVSRWHLLPPEVVHRIARDLAAAYWD